MAAWSRTAAAGARRCAACAAARCRAWADCLPPCVWLLRSRPCRAGAARPRRCVHTTAILQLARLWLPGARRACAHAAGLLVSLTKAPRCACARACACVCVCVRAGPRAVHPARARRRAGAPAERAAAWLACLPRCPPARCMLACAAPHAPLCPNALARSLAGAPAAWPPLLGPQAGWRCWREQRPRRRQRAAAEEGGEVHGLVGCACCPLPPARRCHARNIVLVRD
jgi:hypothetical protein